MFAAFLATVLISISAVCGHRSARLIGGTEANFWRIIFAAGFLAIWGFGFGQGLEGSTFPIFLLSGVIGIGLGDVCYFQSLPRLGPRRALLLVQCLTAPFGALIEWLWLGTTLTMTQMLCGAVILLGIGIALKPNQHLKLSRRELAWGTFAGALAALGGAGGAVLSRKAYAILETTGEVIDPITASFQRVLGGCVLAVISVLLVKRNAFWPGSKNPIEFAPDKALVKWRAVWFWIVLNSLAGQTLGMSCLQSALETTPTGIVLPIVATAPIVVIPIAYIFEGEKPTLHALIGGGVAVAGVIALTLLR